MAQLAGTVSYWTKLDLRAAGDPLVAVGVDTTVGHIERIVTHDLRDLIQTDHADGE